MKRILFVLIGAVCLMSCDNEALRDSLYVYSEKSEPIPMYTQANEHSPIVVMIPSGEAFNNVSWSFDGWMFGEYNIYSKRTNDIVRKCKGYVRRENVRRYSSYNQLPKKDKELRGWRRMMDDYYIVRADKPVPVMRNRKDHIDEYGVYSYTYDTIGWVAPKTLVRPNQSRALYNPDYKNGEYMFSVNASDSVNGFMYGYHLKAKNTNLISRIFWWAYYSNPEKTSKFEMWKERKLATWKRQCRASIYDESRTVWNRYRWHFWGVLLWLILSVALSRTYILAFFIDVVVPWVYISVMPEYFWFASPWLVGWWCILGFPAAIGLFYIFWKKLVGHFMKIWVSIGNLRIILCIYYIIYTLGMAVVCIHLFAGGLSQDVGILVVFFVISMIPASSRGAGDADRVELVDQFGQRIGARLDGNKAYGDDGKIYQQNSTDGSFSKL